MHSLAFTLLPALALGLGAAAIVCPSTTKANYDFIVVGAGNGGGLVAARLAEAKFNGSHLIRSIIQKCTDADGFIQSS